MSDAPAVFAVLTPSGSAAIATVAVAGPEAWRIVKRFFRGAAALPPEPATDRVWHGRFGTPPGDDVVVAARRGGPEPCVEIHCHGGPEVVRMIRGELARAGAHASDAIPDGATGIAHAARAELARASTFRTAAILLDQLNGSFERALAELDDALRVADLDRASALAGALADRAHLGRHLTRPWRVVIAGAPNVGKSSLVNALAGYRRSVVTPVPGTTRDVVVTTAAIDGWPVQLIDTAGDRSGGDALEQEGIARGRSAAAAADLCVWVVDASETPVWPASHAEALFVVNKSDLPPAWDTVAVDGAVAVSALTAVGLDELCAVISRRLVPRPPPAGAAVPFTADLAERIAQIDRSLATRDMAAARAALALMQSAQAAPPG